MAKLHCVWWNLENLFPYDASYTGHANYRPASEGEYEEKLDDLAVVLANMPDGVPDLIFVCEVATAQGVGNRDALADLAARLGGNRGHYLGEVGDIRGITCGAIWNEELVESRQKPEVHPVISRLQLTERGRPIVELAMREKQSGREFTVYLNHWKSRGGDPSDSEEKRLDAAEELMTLVARRVCRAAAPDADPEALILAVGDFNDEPYNGSLTHPRAGQGRLLITRDRRQVLERHARRPLPLLYNPSWRLLGQMLACGGNAGRVGFLPAGTYLYADRYPDRWSTFDQLLVSAGMIRGRDPVFDDASLQIYCRPELLGPTGKPEGPSDHLPVTFALEF